MMGSTGFIFSHDIVVQCVLQFCSNWLIFIMTTKTTLGERLDLVRKMVTFVCKTLTLQPLFPLWVCLPLLRDLTLPASYLTCALNAASPAQSQSKVLGSCLCFGVILTYS